MVFANVANISQIFNCDFVHVMLMNIFKCGAEHKRFYILDGILGAILFSAQTLKLIKKQKGDRLKHASPIFLCALYFVKKAVCKEMNMVILLLIKQLS